MKGLANLGNTCYFNSCLQCLFQIPLLSNYFITQGYEGQCEFTHEYARIVKEYWTNKSQKIQNHQKIIEIFKRKYKNFDNSRQHDAQEVLVCILDLLHKGTKSITLGKRTEIKNPEWEMKTNSIIKDIFYGQIEKSIIYSGGKSVTRENCAHLMFTPLKNTTLVDLIEDMQKDEVIEGYTDSGGRTHHVAVMKQVLINKPEILIMCFNMFMGKVNVELPPKWDQYKLIACCLHMGSTRGGHYVAFTLHKGRWYLKDDECVREMVPNLNNQYYFCIYRKLAGV